jgi:beta-glucanase (GH16 family)
MRRTGRATAARAMLAGAALALGCGLEPPPEQSAQGAPAPAAETLPPPGWASVWADEFAGSALDTSSWRAHSERRLDALSTPDAVSVRNGVLTITTYTGSDGVHRTGFLTTEGRFETRYGYFEARIRFNDAPGSWCAFWLSSPTIGVPLGDPGNAGVEIDVVEHRATDQGGWDALRDMVALNLNWDGYDANKKNVQRVLPLPGGGPVQGVWHRYGVLWTASGYTFYVDDVPLWRTDAAISHRPQDLRLTCEVANGSWAGTVPAGGYGSRATSTARMEVDYVRVFQPPP